MVEHTADARRTGPLPQPLLLGIEPPRTQLNLRGNPSDRRFARAIVSTTGCELPQIPNTVSPSARDHETRLLWLAPDEWLLVAPLVTAEPLQQELGMALRGMHHVLCDQSHARSIIALYGPKSAQLLNKGCSLDLRQRRFAPGQCAQSTLARTQILLHRLEYQPYRDRQPEQVRHAQLRHLQSTQLKIPYYEIYVARSFSRYLWCWLEDASQEYRSESYP